MAIDTLAPTARARFRAHLELLVARHPELDSGELADLVGQTLPDSDRTLVGEFLAAEARNILAWEMRAQFVRTRHGIYSVLDIGNPDAPGVADLDDEKRESLFDRISHWREFVPSENRARPLLELNKPKLLESAQYDAGVTFLHGWKMLLKTRLAERLPDESALVRDHFTPEQVFVLGETIKKEMGRGNFRLKIAPVRALSRTAPVSRPGDGRDAEGSKAD
jgi:hypothetical protein